MGALQAGDRRGCHRIFGFVSHVGFERILTSLGSAASPPCHHF